MTTANFADRPRTGQGRHLLRVDCERGVGWVATHYDPSLRVIQQVRGSDEKRIGGSVHDRWKCSTGLLVCLGSGP
jgi:hypothetical protein